DVHDLNEGKERKQITELNISNELINKYKGEENKIKLKGWLILKGFTVLKELNCSDHQLTDLDLSSCENLTELKCDGNEFKSLNFLKTLPHPKRLEKLYIQNSSKLASKNLDVLTYFTNLKILDISDCSNLKGSLRPLKDLTKIE